MRSHPFPEYPLWVSDKLALFVGFALFVLGGFTVFVLLPAAVRGLYVGEGWAQVFSGALVLLILVLIATSNLGKTILALFASLGGIVSIVAAFTESDDGLLVRGVVLLLIAYFLYLMMDKD
jgi:hypothetical protein